MRHPFKIGEPMVGDVRDLNLRWTLAFCYARTGWFAEEALMIHESCSVDWFVLKKNLRFSARVVELVDTLDLGSSAVRCAGSSPVPGTT